MRERYYEAGELCENRQERETYKKISEKGDLVRRKRQGMEEGDRKDTAVRKRQGMEEEGDRKDTTERRGDLVIKRPRD